MAKRKVAARGLTRSAEPLYQGIRAVLESARSGAYRAVNAAMVQAYWDVGRLIVEHEQGGARRAAYGEAVLDDLSRRLTADFGKGFDVRNLRYMRQFYLAFTEERALSPEQAGDPKRNAPRSESGGSKGVLVAWLEVHHRRVNVPRLGRLLGRADASALVRGFWSAVGTWLGRTDARWRVLARSYRGPRLDLDDPEVTRVQLARVGPDPRFEGSALRVHAKLLRSRAADVDDAVQLASRHSGYLRRVQLGPTYRADVWAALDREPGASPAEIARRVGCAYETARSVAEDWKTARLATWAA